MKYQRLASKRGLGKWHSLWLGDDHLLAVDSTGYSEEYTRYYLKDIQAVITRRTAWGMVQNIICGCALLIMLLVAMAAYDPKSGFTPGLFVAAVCGGIFLLMLLWNIFRGPTCRCHVRVPLGIEELAALGRHKNVVKVLSRLRPRIAQLQGESSREEMGALIRPQQEGASVAAPATARAAAQPAAALTENASASYRGILQGAFLLLLAEAGVSILQLFQNSRPLTTFSAFIIFAFIALIVAALIKQREHRQGSLARNLCWCGLATMIVASVAESFFTMFYGFEQLKSGKMTSNDFIDLSLTIDPLAHPPLAIFRIIYILTICGLGIFGLVSLGRTQAGSKRRRP